MKGQNISILETPVDKILYSLIDHTKSKVYNNSQKNREEIRSCLMIGNAYFDFQHLTQVLFDILLVLRTLYLSFISDFFIDFKVTKQNLPKYLSFHLYISILQFWINFFRFILVFSTIFSCLCFTLTINESMWLRIYQKAFTILETAIVYEWWRRTTCPFHSYRLYPIVEF